MSSMDFAQILKEQELRVTEGRLAVLSFLEQQSVPVSIKSIQSSIDSIDRVTLYRMMEQFEKKQLVRSCDLGHGHKDYELAIDNHRHHLVCRDCDVIEEVEICRLDGIEDELVKQSTNFSSVDQHKLTFMGTCNDCK